MLRVDILRGLAMLLCDAGSFKRIFIKKNFWPCVALGVGCYFPHQGLNLGHCIESAKC